MYPSSELCRIQEKAQLDRAAASPLANVRSIATKAADMWRLEGIGAEKREKRAAALVADRTSAAFGRAQRGSTDDPQGNENLDLRSSN